MHEEHEKGTPLQIGIPRKADHSLTGTRTIGCRPDPGGTSRSDDVVSFHLSSMTTPTGSARHKDARDASLIACYEGQANHRKAVAKAAGRAPVTHLPQC